MWLVWVRERGVFVDEQQYLTVKQFAERAGVSTQRIYQLLSKSLQAFTKVENGTKYISIEGLRVFDKEPMQEVAKDLQIGLQEVANPEMELLRETIEALRQQLTVKDEQLATKDAQLSEKDKQLANLTSALRASQEQAAALTTALTAAQALHAATVQERIEERSAAAAEAVEGSPSEVPAGEEPQQEQKRKGFFKRIFGRKGE